MVVDKLICRETCALVVRPGFATIGEMQKRAGMEGADDT